MIYDYLIVGAGVAGLSAGRNLPRDKKVLIVCKKSPWECNTFYAQGGITSAVDKNDIKLHIKDTLEAGVYLNDKNMVRILSENSIDVIQDLASSGMKFDLEEDGNIAYTKEAAHSRSRVIHADGDATGRELHSFLLSNCEHQIMSDSIVIDLLYQDGICYGVHLIHKNKDKVIYAHNTILASGGVGSIYKYHTNSITVAGDIQGICFEKNIPLKDMEMMQFHPSVFIKSPTARKQLLTEALRGEGAIVEAEDGYAFLKDYHKDAELAPRDIVSRAIFDYSQKHNTQIYLSFKNFQKKDFQKRFPNIYKDLKEIGFDLPFERVPISPAFHYSMGGIKVNKNAKVLNTKNLYAVGEVACSGVHGANRLASNSLLEGLVFSKIAVNYSLKQDFKIIKNDYTLKIKDFVLLKSNDKAIKDDLRSLMWERVGIIRVLPKLKNALEQINLYLDKDIGRLLFLRLLTAKSIIQSAIKRTKSIGAHYIKEN